MLYHFSHIADYYFKLFMQEDAVIYPQKAYAYADATMNGSIISLVTLGLGDDDILCSAK